MDKLLALLRLEPLSGSRTKIAVLVSGILMVLHDAAILPEQYWQIILKVAPFIISYFGIEHLDKYFGPKKP